MPSPLLSLDNVHLTLASRAGPVHILQGVTAQVNAGEAVGIVGPSGSGKTSLLMVVSGLEPATSGRVMLDGRDLTGLPESDLARIRRESVGIIFQSFHLIPTLTAIENVAIPMEFRGLADAAGRARAALARVGLAHRLDHYPGQLSGGEQQRVAIARAIAAGAKVFLADEPTGNLDQDTGQAIIDLLFDLREREGATLLLVTHDRSLAQRCGRIIEVRDGKLNEARAA